MIRKTIPLVQGLIEVSKGSRVKGEIDQNGQYAVDRILRQTCPFNYGCALKSKADDDDPADIVILCCKSLPPMARVDFRPIGLMLMIDDGVADHKIIGVIPSCPRYGDVTDLCQLTSDFLNEVRQFFSTYKQHDGVAVDVLGYESADIAVQWIRETQQRYQQQLCGLNLA